MLLLLLLLLYAPLARWLVSTSLPRRGMRLLWLRAVCLCLMCDAVPPIPKWFPPGQPFENFQWLSQITFPLPRYFSVVQIVAPPSGGKPLRLEEKGHNPRYHLQPLGRWSEAMMT